MAGWMQRIARIARHRWSEGQVPRTFSPLVLEQLTEAVSRSESLHTGQVRLCVEGGLPYSYLWRDAPARQRAVTLFGKLRVWDTEDNNGVLIYLLMADHAIEVVADRGLTGKVPSERWQAIVQDLSRQCREGHHAQGLEAALQRVSDLLTAHFPSSVPHDGRPETAGDLPDAPVVQGRFLKDV